MILSNKYFTYQEFFTKIIDETVINGNLNKFLLEEVQKKFKKNKDKSLDKLIICKEDKE